MRCSRPHSWGDARIEDGVWGRLCHPLSRLRAKGGDTLAQTGTASLRAPHSRLWFPHYGGLGSAGSVPSPEALVPGPASE